MIGQNGQLEGRRAHWNEPIEYIYFDPSLFNPNFTLRLLFVGRRELPSETNASFELNTGSLRATALSIKSPVSREDRASAASQAPRPFTHSSRSLNCSSFSSSPLTNNHGDQSQEDVSDPFIQGRTSISSGPYPSFLEKRRLCRPRWSRSSGVHGCSDGVLDCRGT